MHENVLQSIGNREELPQQSQNPYTNYFLEELYPRKNSAVVQPMPIQPQEHTPEKENQLKHKQSACVSPVLPGTGSITHNITRMLSESTPSGKQPNELFRSVFPSYDMTGYFNKNSEISNNGAIFNRNKTSTEDDSIIDVETDQQEHLRTGDLPNMTDSSISTQESSSPQSSGAATSPASSNNSSPGSTADPVTSPDAAESEPPKKKARTNYTPEQIQTLLKIFHENPYPDSEHMEDIGKELGVPENKIKIWFQNKRARWRRRVNDNMNAYPHQQQPFMPVSPIMSPMAHYGFMPPAAMMRSSPPSGFPGYFNIPWMQGQVSPNGNQPFVNTNMQRYPQTTQPATMPQQQYSPTGYPVATTTSPYSMRTSPTHMMTSQNGRQLQYPQFPYIPSYSGSQQ